MRGDKGEEEEEERTKPLAFSTSRVCWTASDAACHLYPSLLPDSPGAGDTVAAVSLGECGSVHPLLRRAGRVGWKGRTGRL